jgi:3-dehydroquinate dehydratase/shikimate dehydrogenase
MTRRERADSHLERGLIAVALNEPTTEAMCSALQVAAHIADVVELRIDLLEEPERADLPRLLADRPCPVIVTCRAVREGGRWPGSEERRLDVLREAIALGAEYVDVEADTFHQITERGASQLIASSHDFAAMPPDVPARWKDLAATGADVVKIVGMAHDARDVVPMLHALQDADRPTIAIGMGEAGLASRVLALREPACLLAFCALEAGGGTAPGQIGACEMVSVYGARSLSRATEVIGVLGPRADGESLRRWNDLLRRDGQDAVAVPLVVPDPDALAANLDALRPLGFRGYLVEPAYQEIVGQIVDGLDGSACRVGAVNTVRVEANRLVGGWIADENDARSLLLGTAAR